MRPPVSQLILDFEPPVGSRSEDVHLLLFQNEREYFDARRLSIPEYRVTLPKAFQETALMDSGGWRKTPRRSEAAQDLGHRMWMNLPPEVRNSVLEGGSGDPKRVAVMSTHCGMDDIPWEWISDDLGQPIAANDSVRFVRLVPTLYAAPPLSVTPPARVLIVLTNPKDESFLNAGVEIDVITEGLRGNSSYRFDVLMEPRLEKLKAALESSPPHIVHYVGHSGISGSMGNLILHDYQEGTRWLPAAEFARFLPSSVRLLCLSTCVTTQNYQVGGLPKFAHCTTEVQLPTTIANQYALTEPGARFFWQRFYPALAEYDGNAVEAFHSARRAVFTQNLDTWCWASFTMVVRDGSGHPLQIAKPNLTPNERFNTELQAQWSTRLANSLATRMRSLGEEAQQHWEPVLNDEAARVESLENELEE